MLLDAGLTRVLRHVEPAECLAGTIAFRCAIGICPVQLDALTAAGCTVVRFEKVSGTTTDGREDLATLLQFMHEASPC